MICRVADWLPLKGVAKSVALKFVPPALRARISRAPSTPFTSATRRSGPYRLLNAELRFRAETTPRRNKP